MLPLYVRPNQSSSSPILEIWPNYGAQTLLFYPGSMLGPRHYNLLLQAFRKTGFTVVGLHLAGHDLNLATRLDSFKSLLLQGLEAETWLEKNNYGPLIVCGHSQGGILALAHASESSRLRAAFAISAIFPQLDDAIELTRFAHFARYRKNILKYIIKFASLMPWFPIPLPAYLSIKKILAGKQKPSVMGSGFGRLSYPLKYLADLFSTNISVGLLCPFYLYSALNDALFTPKLIQKTFDVIKAPQKHLVWLENGGHMAPLNPYWANFIAKNTAEACIELGSSLHLQ